MIRAATPAFEFDFLPQPDDSLGVIFASREVAGQEIGRQLARENKLPDLVIGLPRGGVIVAAEIAAILQRPLGVIVVRKIGHPRQREFAVGALAEGNVVLLDDAAIQDVPAADLAEVIAKEKRRLLDYQGRFHGSGGDKLEGQNILIVDDGLATGATAEAAVLSARKQGAREITIAVPVASSDALHRLNTVADAVFSLIVDPDFIAVGRYYERFLQVTDDQVISSLHAHA